MPSSVPVKFRPNLKGGYSVLETCVSFECDRRSLFLETPLTEGIWRWTVHITYGDSNILGLGVVSSDSLTLRDEDGLWKDASLIIWEDSLTCAIRGTKNYEEFDISECIPVFSMEADMDTRTLAFYLDDTRWPWVISNIPVPSHFGISAMPRPDSWPKISKRVRERSKDGKPRFTSLSLRRLPAATPSFSPDRKSVV